MHRTDRIISILFLGFGAYLVASSRQFPYWQDFGPGPGYFPFWLGCLMLFLSSILVVISFFFTKGGKGTGINRGTMYPLFVIAAMLICFVLMNYLGFAVPVLLFILVLMEFLERKKRMLHVGVMLLTGFILYYVFVYWMGIPFPTGFLGI